ncbi:MAG: P-loop NTPase [Halorubrum sp.]
MIAVAGGKGGSGKTTTTVGVARALSRRGAPVVAADADWDLPNLARLAGETDPPATTVDADLSPGRSPAVSFEPPRSIPVDAVARGAVDVPDDRAAPTVLTAPNRPAATDATAVFDALGRTVPPDRPVLLDCPAGASPDAIAPLRAASWSLLVTPLRRSALRDAVKTAAIARRLDCPPLGVVVTRANTVPDALVDLLSCPVFGRVPPAAPEPLSEPAVSSAYDTIAERLVDTHGRGRWRVA